MYIILYFVLKFHLQSSRALRMQTRINIRINTHTHGNINRLHLKVYIPRSRTSLGHIETELSAPSVRIFRSEVNKNVREYSRYIRLINALFNWWKRWVCITNFAVTQEQGINKSGQKSQESKCVFFISYYLYFLFSWHLLPIFSIRSIQNLLESTLIACVMLTQANAAIMRLRQKWKMEIQMQMQDTWIIGKHVNRVYDIDINTRSK